MNFQNKKVLVVGLGINGGGVGSARFFAKQGAKVKVTDLKTKKELAPSLEKLRKFPIKYVLGQHRKKDFLEADLIIRNPAVPINSPYLKLARKAHIPIEMESSIFFRLFPPSKIIAITGTKGKTTTTHLIKNILQAAGQKVIMAGNFGVSLFDALPKLKGKTKAVLEMSSWQLEGLEFCQLSPHIAVITNIYPDHLNRYPSMEAYVKAKELISKYQSRNDFLILNRDNSWTKKIKKHSRAKIKYFSYRDITREIKDIYPLRGKHNLENLAAAIKVAELFKVSLPIIKKAIKNFHGVPNRLEMIREVKGIKFYNDTTATTPIAAQAAISSLSGPIIWILGGAEKNLPFDDLAKAAAKNKKIKAAIFLEGAATKRLWQALKKAHTPFSFFGPFNNFNQAIKKAYSLAQKGDNILLSPACASFGMFQNEFDRGEQFKTLVEKIAHEKKTQ